MMMTKLKKQLLQSQKRMIKKLKTKKRKKKKELMIQTLKK